MSLVFLQSLAYTPHCMDCFYPIELVLPPTYICCNLRSFVQIAESIYRHLQLKELVGILSWNCAFVEKVARWITRWAKPRQAYATKRKS